MATPAAAPAIPLLGGAIPIGQPVMLPVGTESTTTTASTGGRVMAPASKEAIAQEHRAGVDIATQQREVGDALADRAEVDADLAGERARMLREQGVDLAMQQQDQRDRVAAAREAYAAAEEVFANHKFEDYFDGAPITKKLAAGFELFAGGAGASYNGGANFAAEALGRSINRHFEQQKIELDKAREIARRRGQDVNDLFVQEGHENAALAIKHAKALEATAAAAIEAQTRAGIPVDQAKNNVQVAQMLSGAEEKRREALQHYDRTFQNSTARTSVTGGTPAASADDSIINDSQGRPFANAQTPEAAKTFKDRQRALTDLAAATNELEESYKKGWVLPGGFTDAGAHRAGVLKRITLATKTIGELGALSGPDEKLADDIAGGKLGQILARPGGIQNLRQMHGNALNTSMSQIGAKPTPENRARFDPIPLSGVPDATAAGLSSRAPTPAVNQRAPEKPQKLTGEDNVAISEARRRLKRNPGDAVARQVLELHGLDK